MATTDDTQAALSYELAVYREQISMIRRETERVSLTTIDLTNALKTAENLEPENVLIPIGGGTMVKGIIKDIKMLVPVGGGYLVEMDKKSASDELSKRIDATKRAVERLNEEFSKIAGKVQELSMQLQRMQTQTRISDEVDRNIHEDYI